MPHLTRVRLVAAVGQAVSWSVGDMKDRSHLLTEQRLEASADLDLMSVSEALALLHEQDLVAVKAVGAVLPEIARAVEMVVAAFSAGGRLIYVGAGTSGRLGVLDAAECPPTFQTDPNMVQAVIAGGEAAIRRAVEGAEDRADGGAAEMDRRGVGPADVVMGIAAGGTTPFVLGALRRAAERSAKTIFLTCVQPSTDEPRVDLIIRPLTGPEVLTGSTRLKAGTATKLVLNAITTVAMVRSGKVYGNLMVDLRATNEKLRDRAARIVCTLTGLSRQAAIHLLERAGGSVKRAVVMHRLGLEGEAAAALLAACGGNLRKALDHGKSAAGNAHPK